ncbi:MAG: hypothetical protein HOK88_05140, partial [Candidatus Marinimicrobia bacterium]|nr:hypothetical protein [Candidatus Neomarinimicrobiota bacterium]
MNLFKFLSLSSFLDNSHSVKKFNVIIFFSLIFISFSCSSKTETFNKYVSKEKNLQFLVAQGKLHWDKRVNIKDANLAKLFLSKANELNPDNAEIVELYARACHFVGYYLQSNLDKSDSLFIEGMNTTWSYIISTNAYQEGAALFDGDSTGKKIAGITNISKEMVPILYWWASNYSRYLSKKPVMDRLQSRDLIETALHRILSLEPDYFYHGANRLFGGIYARLPGVELNLSVNNFDKAITGSPNYLGTYVVRAEYLHTKSGNREAFTKD